MDPVEEMCAAWWDIARGTTGSAAWKLVDVVTRANHMKRMRGALRALAANPSKAMVISSGGLGWMVAKDAILLAAAEGETTLDLAGAETGTNEIFISSVDVADVINGAWQRIFWDEESQSVKTEIIPCEEVLKEYAK